MSSGHRLQPGLQGYLIPFAPLAFVPHRRIRSGLAPSPRVVSQGLQDFTPTPGIPQTSPGPKSSSFPSKPHSWLRDFTKDLLGRLRTL